MTLDEAKEILEEIKLNDDCLTQYIAGFDEALDMAIKVLEQDPCEDAVSREFLLRDLLLKAQGEKDVSIKWLKEYINSLLSVTPQPKTGHWIEEFNDLEGEVRFTCSCCGKYQLFGTDYCYNCGAKMIDPQESEIRMREFIDKSTVSISKTIGGQNDFADCIRDSVKAVIDNAETVTEQEIVKSYLNKLKERIDEQIAGGSHANSYDSGWDDALSEVFDMIDKILSELENGNDWGE